MIKKNGPVTGSGTLHRALRGPVTGYGTLHWTLRGLLLNSSQEEEEEEEEEEEALTNASRRVLNKRLQEKWAYYLPYGSNATNRAASHVTNLRDPKAQARQFPLTV